MWTPQREQDWTEAPGVNYSHFSFTGVASVSDLSEEL